MLKILIPLFLITSTTKAQLNGLLSLNKDKVYDAYTLVYPHNQPTVFLLNNCGQIVHRWDDEVSSRPGNTAYLMSDGRLVKTRRPANVSLDTIWAGGGGDEIAIVDWDNNELWSYKLNNGKERLHHDIKVMPNGNILAIAWENLSKQEAIDLGRDPALLSQEKLWPDFIFEINPTSNQIIWEWHIIDHLVQDFDSTKPNFGTVKDHPELVNLNYDTSNGAADWLHSNALDYNPDLDQILLSVPTFSEIWVIDHSTTTAQAASHKGGKSNKGGDIMYRIGNPQAYDRGTAADQTLFYQHNAHWELELPINHKNYGSMVVFNNQVSATESTIEIFDAPWNMYTWSYDKTDSIFLPKTFTNTLKHPGPKPFASDGLSSAQILPNNNVLLLSGRQGYIVELTENRDIVWEYVMPLKAGKAVETNLQLNPNENLTFNAHKYKSDFAAFINKDLTVKGYIELNPDTALCERITSLIHDNLNKEVYFYPNPVTDKIYIDNYEPQVEEIFMFNINGKEVWNSKVLDGNSIDVSMLPIGIYLLQLKKMESLFPKVKL